MVKICPVCKATFEAADRGPAKRRMFCGKRCRQRGPARRYRMKKRSVSVAGATYRAIRAAARQAGVTMTCFVEGLIHEGIA